MNQSTETDAQNGPAQRSDLPPGLSALVERLRALSSAWGVLAPSGLSAEKTDIAETGRTLNDDLMELARCDTSQPDLAANAVIEARIDSLEAEMCAIAFKVPIVQLRSTLPECVSHNRRGVLDLLDLMLGAELQELDGTEARIPAFDYLITLLCSGGSDQPLTDPVQLTPRLHELCERSSVDYDPRLPDIEAEFFHAADLYEADARNEEQLLALQMRKAELGSSYFSPQVLRAIVAYNAALLERIDDEVLASQNWGALPPVADEPEELVSVFDTTALPRVAQALRRRVAGDAPELCATDRIAWCLDLEYPTSGERRALLEKSAGRSENIIGTVVLVGLLCRSAVVLEDEFPAIGITSGQLFDAWVPELSEVLQQHVNQRISSDEYREACLLSELKSRYLYASMAEVKNMNLSRAPTPTPSPDTAKPEKTAETAKTIIKDAISDEQTATSRCALPDRKLGKTWSARRLAAIGVLISCALVILWMGRTYVWNPDHAHFDRAQLDQLSSLLTRGTRSGNGQGPAFVGEIGDGWSALQVSDQILVVTDIVETLRERGVRDVMIYDDDGLLRIQALGDQPPRILPGAAPEH